MKFYRDIGIDLSGFNPIYHLGDSWENGLDSFNYHAF
jgi:hypothetical protein